MVELGLSIEKSLTMILSLQVKKCVKIKHEEECNNIFVLVGASSIDQAKIETLKGILRFVLKA